ncbi:MULTISPECIES: LapA family protein [unclassified Enterococcus]|uniref:LapA family protein n=1 Tax=unclassified Enterococcus TaxID=2608891 RepID=UPI00201B4222|nr:MULTISPECIES: LapA family protein [unclassified Enterococcus]
MDTLKKIATPKRVIALIILILITIFAFQNMNSVELMIIFFSVKLPLLFLILGVFFLGIFTGWSIKRNDVKKIVADVQSETQKEISNLQKQLKEK